MTKIKICGLKRSEDIGYVNDMRPDYIGFVFAKSKRQVTREQAAQLKTQLAPGIQAVGVFVKEEATQIAKIAKAGIIDLIQLHGDETPEFCRLLRYLTDKPIIKVIRVKNKASFHNLAAYDCDYFLLDTYTVQTYGGAGQIFAWNTIDKSLIPKPFFVAGGLTAANVGTVLKQVAPFGVDTSGGVETAGHKDKKKIAAFLAAVRSETND